MATFGQQNKEFKEPKSLIITDSFTKSMNYTTKTPKSTLDSLILNENKSINLNDIFSGNNPSNNINISRIL